MKLFKKKSTADPPASNNEQHAPKGHSTRDLLFEPVKGYKYAFVAEREDFSICFVGMAFANRPGTGSYSQTATATCGADRLHAAPQTDCDCGFHIGFEKDYVQQLYNAPKTCALLEVELSENVELHEHGARGAHQQVLSVQFSSACAWCARELEHELARVAKNPFHIPKAINPLRATTLVLASCPGSPYGFFAPACTKHAEDVNASLVLTCQDLAHRLGVPVSIDPAPPGYTIPKKHPRRWKKMSKYQRAQAADPLGALALALVAIGLSLLAVYSTFFKGPAPSAFTKSSATPWVLTQLDKGPLHSADVLSWVQEKTNAAQKTPKQHATITTSTAHVRLFHTTTKMCYAVTLLLPSLPRGAHTTHAHQQTIIDLRSTHTADAGACMTAREDS